jgi:hypothetical protein
MSMGNAKKHTEHISDYVFASKDVLVKMIESLNKTIDSLSVEATDQDITNAVAKLIRIRKNLYITLSMPRIKK